MQLVFVMPNFFINIMIKSTLKSKNTQKNLDKLHKQDTKLTMQNLLEKLKEIELMYYLSPKLSEDQINLLIQKFEEIIKNSNHSDFQLPDASIGKL